MTRDELEHAIRAACDVAGDDAIYVFGSQAILGQFPDAAPALRQSMEVDVAPCSRLDRIDHIDGSLGELSRFHATFGFYVHGLGSISWARTPGGVGLPRGLSLTLRGAFPDLMGRARLHRTSGSTI